MHEDVNDLLSVLRDDADTIARRFKTAGLEGKGTAQEIADYREHAVQNFVGTYFPFPFRVTKGVIRDHTGARSMSVDCILLNPVHPHTVDTHGKFRLIFADGVDAAIEVKPDISRKGLVSEALEQSLSVKSLRRAEPVVRIARLLGQPKMTPEEKAHAARLPSFVYAMKGKVNLLDTAREVVDFYTARKIDRVDQIDAIVVHGVGILANYQYVGQFGWRTEGTTAASMPPGKHVGWVFETWGRDTLAGLLLHLNAVYPSIIRTARPVLDHYLMGIQVGLGNVEEELRKAAERPRPQSKRHKRRRKPAGAAGTSSGQDSTGKA